MRALFLTEYYPFDLRTDVFGVFKRMRMLMDAVVTFADVDVLFFSTLGVDESPAAIRQLEINLTEQWGLHLNVFLRHQKVRSRKALWKRLPFWIRCARLGAVAYHSHLSLDTSHEPSVRAVDSCLDRRPDFILAFRLGTMAPLLRT